MQGLRPFHGFDRYGQADEAISPCAQSTERTRNTLRLVTCVRVDRETVEGKRIGPGGMNVSDRSVPWNQLEAGPCCEPYPDPVDIVENDLLLEVEHPTVFDLAVELDEVRADVHPHGLSVDFQTIAREVFCFLRRRRVRRIGEHGGAELRPKGSAIKRPERPEGKIVSIGQSGVHLPEQTGFPGVDGCLDVGLDIRLDPPAGVRRGRGGDFRCAVGTCRGGPGVSLAASREEPQAGDQQDDGCRRRRGDEPGSFEIRPFCHDWMNLLF